MRCEQPHNPRDNEPWDIIPWNVDAVFRDRFRAVYPSRGKVRFNAWLDHMTVVVTDGELWFRRHANDTFDVDGCVWHYRVMIGEWCTKKRLVFKPERVMRQSTDPPEEAEPAMEPLQLAMARLNKALAGLGETIAKTPEDEQKQRYDECERFAAHCRPYIPRPSSP